MLASCHIWDTFTIVEKIVVASQQRKPFTGRSCVRPHATTGLSSHSIDFLEQFPQASILRALAVCPVGSVHGQALSSTQFTSAYSIIAIDNSSVWPVINNVTVNCSCQIVNKISTHTFRRLDADVFGRAFCPNQVNCVLQFDWLLLSDPLYAQTAVGESLTQLTTLVYLLFGDLHVMKSCSYFSPQ